MSPFEYSLLTSSDWKDYELLDSGNGQKLERYGPYCVNRPEAEAVWQPALDENTWKSAHACYQISKEGTGGHWDFFCDMPSEWIIEYKRLKLRVKTSGSRHLGVFPEQAGYWDWISSQIQSENQHNIPKNHRLNVLNLFGYTGLASLAAAQAGAYVTHLDASRKVINWARENQQLSGLIEKPIRYIIDDALKFVQREGRRNFQYDGLILDPPKFGRGPKGEMWEFYKLLPKLLHTCREILCPSPIFIALTAYAVKASPITLYHALSEMMQGIPGQLEAGEIGLIEKSAGRTLATAIFARWSKQKQE